MNVKKGRGWGDFILVAKNMGGDYIHLCKNDQGGFFPGGILSVSLDSLSVTLDHRVQCPRVGLGVKI